MLSVVCVICVSVRLFVVVIGIVIVFFFVFSVFFIVYGWMVGKLSVYVIYMLKFCLI